MLMLNRRAGGLTELFTTTLRVMVNEGNGASVNRPAALEAASQFPNSSVRTTLNLHATCNLWIVLAC